MSQLPSVVQRYVDVIHRHRLKRDPHQALQLLAHLRAHELDTDSVLGNHLVPMLVDCGCLHDALHVFYSLPNRNEHSWSSIISGQVDQGNVRQAFDLYHLMYEDSVHPSSFTLIVLLRACANQKDQHTGWKLHTQVIKQGADGIPVIGNALVDMYGKCCSLVEAQNVFGRLLCPCTVSWNALISGHADSGLGKDALLCFKKMVVCPDDVTYSCSLKACCNISAIEDGQVIHTAITMRGLEMDLFLGNSLIDMYAKCGALADAHDVLHNLPIRDAVSWNALILGYAECGFAKDAYHCFEQMRFNSVLSEDFWASKSYHPRYGYTYATLLKACTSSGETELGKVLHSDILKTGLEGDTFVSKTMVDMYGKFGLLAEALKVFGQLSNRDIVSWNALAAGYVEHGLGEEALCCIEQMQLDGLSPDAVTFSCSLKACNIVGALECGKDLHADICKKRMEANLHEGTPLMDVHANCGWLLEVQKSFGQFPNQNVVSWYPSMGDLFDNGLASNLEHVQIERVSPDACMHVSSLKAFHKVDIMIRVCILHTEINKRGLETQPYVGTALMDSYFEYGLLEEARVVFEKQPHHDMSAWAVLMTGYSECGCHLDVLDCLKEMESRGLSADAGMLMTALKACSSLGALESGREIHAEVRKLGLDGDLHIGNMLIDMYGTCGSLTEAYEVFDTLPCRNLVLWNTVISMYGRAHEIDKALECVEQMQKEGVLPNAITFTYVLVACSHVSMVLKGQEYFTRLKPKHGIEVVADHYVCMVDLLARSGRVHEAEKFARVHQCFSVEVLKALLSACKTFCEVEIGMRCFHRYVEMKPDDAMPYSLMADICTSVCLSSDGSNTEEIMKVVHQSALADY